jgi:hypothetical protein
MNKIFGIALGLCLCFCLAPVAASAAEAANMLGVFGNWSALSSGTGDKLTCFALSRPRATRPANTKRGPIYLMVSDWPSRNVKAEPQIVYGYQSKEGSAGALGVGADKFSFFIRNNGKEASAWLQKLGDNARLIAAMQDGVSAVASGASAKGTKTSDTYSLAGFNDALAKIHSVCQM